MLPRLIQKISQDAFLREISSSEELIELLTLDELAGELVVRKEKAAMLAHRNIGCYKIGNRVLVSRKALDDILTNSQ
jgi:hypothetical protein